MVRWLPADLRAELPASSVVLAAWTDVTLRTRNELICRRGSGEELGEGMRRPYGWPGCKHRGRTGE